jgi:hypothetical protein
MEPIAPDGHLELLALSLALFVGLVLAERFFRARRATRGMGPAYWT